MADRPPRPPKRREPPRRLEVGSVVGRTFAIWWRNLPSFATLAVIAHLPVLAFAIGFSFGDIDGPSLTTWMQWHGRAATLFGFVASAAIMYGVAQELRGDPAGTGECIRKGLPRIPGAVGVGVLVFLLDWGPSVLVQLVTPAAPSGIARQGMAMVVGLAVGLLAIFVGVVLAVAVPVRVVETVGIWESLRRSARLTHGSRWPVLWIMVLVGLIAMAAHLSLSLTVVRGYFGHAEGDIWTSVVASSSPESIKAFVVASTLLVALTGSLSAVMSAVIYHDLRVAKEGVTADELARVFD